MSIRYLLDTDTVSLALKGRAPSAVTHMRAVPRERIGISVVTAMELSFGLAKNPAARVKQVVEDFLATVQQLPLDEDCVGPYAEIRADLERRGCLIGPLDTLIAAHAISWRATLVTANVREFRRVRGLRCVNWAQQP